MRFLYYIRNVKSKDDERNALAMLKKQEYFHSHNFRDVYWDSRRKRYNNTILICDDYDMPEYNDESDIEHWTGLYRRQGFEVKELSLDPTNIGDL